MHRRSRPQVIRLPAGPVPRPSRLARLLPGPMAARLSPRKRRRRRPQRGVMLLAATAAFMSSTAVANPPMNSGLEQFGAKVSDEQLGDMRGKFVRPGNISYFGISMATSWQNSDQITTSAVLLFSVAFAHGAGGADANPMVAVAWNRDCSGCADPAMDVAGFGPAAQGGYLAVTATSQLIPVGGLDSVHGAVQSQQIAGTDNRVTNAMQLAIVPSSTAHQMDTSQLHALSQSTAENFSDGSSLGFIVSANHLGISMAGADGHSALRQGVDGSLNQASQHVFLNDSFNSISNAMTITIGIDGPPQGQGLSSIGDLGALKGRF